MKHKPLTIDEAVHAVRSAGGCIQCNILKYRRWRGVEACFKAAKKGMLKKKRISCAIYQFTIPPETNRA